MIAAYALVLQAFLAYSMATQAAAQDPASFSGAFFVICSSHDASDAPDGDQAKLKLNTHCPICTTASFGAATVPDVVALPGTPAAFSVRLAFVSVDACVAYHQARAGLSRAPPQNA
ncbi:DUF2946 family protein [Rhodoplanes sp. Z2-YC6860]|uniref:DUF2946 family protein n=1 Tax=Rhodoplanes sp. Z2-YC6860 TaxID=674703 RepID=UPI00082B305C|nr:DUF2946 family protein [Rhodoplanes sp. Z2-YC6860]